MTQESKVAKPSFFKPSFSLIVLDMLGSLCFGLGLAKMFAGIDFLPKAIQFDEKGWTLIIIGVLCMLPMLLQLIAKIREQAEKKRIK